MARVSSCAGSGGRRTELRLQGETGPRGMNDMHGMRMSVRGGEIGQGLEWTECGTMGSVVRL